MTDIKMDYSTKSDLISQLANKFNGETTDDLKIETSNYIPSTQTMDCSAMGLDVDTLKKTKRVIEQHEKKFSASSSPESAQYLLHLRVAKKCVEEIIAKKIR